MSDTWIQHVGTQPPGCLGPCDVVEVDLGEGSPVAGVASSFSWGAGAGPNGEGGILRWRRLLPAMVGDLKSNEAGSGARFNAGKAPLDLIPLEIIADYRKRQHQTPPRVPRSAADWSDALRFLGAFQMRPPWGIDQRGYLLDALLALDNDGQLWAECAAVFDYGRKKYAAWNWSKGMAWSVPIGCAARHVVFGPMRGEANDAESKLTHRGHFACNIVMLLWFIDHYPQGDDRIVPVVSPSADHCVPAK